MQQIVITKRQRQFDVPGAVRLRNGVALLEPTPSTLAVGPAVLGDVKTPSTSGDWHPDPTQRYGFRWWDGTRWTQRVATNGRAMSDPVVYETISCP
jgi:hypothetical protein